MGAQIFSNLFIPALLLLWCEAEYSPAPKLPPPPPTIPPSVSATSVPKPTLPIRITLQEVVKTLQEHKKQLKDIEDDLPSLQVSALQHFTDIQTLQDQSKDVQHGFLELSTNFSQHQTLANQNMSEILLKLNELKLSSSKEKQLHATNKNWLGILNRNISGMGDNIEDLAEVSQKQEQRLKVLELALQQQLGRTRNLETENAQLKAAYQNQSKVLEKLQKPSTNNKKPRDDFFKYDNSLYKFVPALATWTAAAAHCQSLDPQAYLVSIETVQENRFINRLARGVNEVFIGAFELNYDKKWAWLGTGRELAYSNWNTGEPSDHKFSSNNEKEACAVMFTSNGKWNDILCDSPTEFHSFICEIRLP
ncbi:C-type lectin domain family 4 member G [Lingula anatina]|uniref:C-type lectin domain family 4 member G n=1 Tax=Lingula anatina TaxID=7574 RepID=A0A1S3JRJ1_LINAN|nr:C-type lectin domain family 4 member G [Lingula anatina]|eukprot:XP_013412711.1 C-type lectin domain family 4 member G [Lingula anatina]